MWGLESYPIFNANESIRGMVVEQYQKKNEKTTEIVYFTLIGISSTSGEKVRFQSSSGSAGESANDNGTIVSVLYDSHNPARVMIGSFK
jgi:hypothetical protein